MFTRSDGLPRNQRKFISSLIWKWLNDFPLHSYLFWKMSLNCSFTSWIQYGRLGCKRERGLFQHCLMYPSCFPRSSHLEVTLTSCERGLSLSKETLLTILHCTTFSFGGDSLSFEISKVFWLSHSLWVISEIVSGWVLPFVWSRFISF